MRTPTGFENSLAQWTKSGGREKRAYIDFPYMSKAPTKDWEYAKRIVDKGLITSPLLRPIFVMKK